MKARHLRHILVLLAAFAQSLHGQNHFGYWGERWDDWLLRSQEDKRTFLHERYFRDTVQVREMKEAFRKYKDASCERSLYEGFDSVSFPMEGHGSSIMLVSPLRQHPDRKVRECRGVWAYPRYRLLDLTDKSGASQTKLIAKLNDDEGRHWLDGEILRLEEPRWYMGFVVSPSIYWDIYSGGKHLADTGSSVVSPDFFSFAEVTALSFGGYWDKNIQAGARLMGAMCGMEYVPAVADDTERTFSVLMYQKPMPSGKSRQEKPYMLELLEPEQADDVTHRLFRDLKSFIENLPAGTFKPYYTADLRILTGRYLRVTASKCGWLIEDYLVL